VPMVINDSIASLVKRQAELIPDKIAIEYKNVSLSYFELNRSIENQAQVYRDLGIKAGDRIAIKISKNPLAIISLLAANTIGAVFVPINLLLKEKQVQHILDDSGACLLVTESAEQSNTEKLSTNLALTSPENLACILYTSGSTGNAKGVMLSHNNLLVGAQSVTEYLNNSSDDRILSVLPLSFDYGLNQIISAFYVGATVVLMDYLFPKDIIKAVEKFKITGLALIPTLWNQLAHLDWPKNTLTYATSSGANLPKNTLFALQKHLPNTAFVPMYGLTEAFRATYLKADETLLHPTSIGKAIPNAELVILNSEGQESGIDEIGELVQLGALVTLGYWNNLEATKNTFKPVTIRNNQMGVFSGDFVKKDKEGYLYFISRKDKQIKTSGFRVSPSEIEAVALSVSGIQQAVAIGVPDDILGQRILFIIEAGNDFSIDSLKKAFISQLPTYMFPAYLCQQTILPRTVNQKIDIAALTEQFLNNDLPIRTDW